MKDRVSDIITKQDIVSWSKGNIITIKAGTGTGKSYFIKNDLYDYAKHEGKKILMLLHRKNALMQFEKEIIRDKKTDIIHLMTYQKIEADYINGIEFDYSNYDYIVCDEFHYFLGDAAFNKKTDISIESILNQKNKVKIFMSATGDNVNQYLVHYRKLKTIRYSLPKDYSYVQSLHFFDKKDTFEKLAREFIEKNEKAIFFIQNAETVYELHNKFKDNSLFNCSERNKYYKYVNKVQVEKMLEAEKFEKNILFTTTVFDAGVNIKDIMLKNIVIEVDDIGSLIQCIGRKRVISEPGIEPDTLSVYIRNISPKRIEDKKAKLKASIKKANYLKLNGTREYVIKYGREYDSYNIVYDKPLKDIDKCTKAINYMAYFKVISDSFILNDLLREGNLGYIKYMSDYLEIEDYKLIDMNKDLDSGSIEEFQLFLDNNIGIKLYGSENRDYFYETACTLAGAKLAKKHSKIAEYLNNIYSPKYNIIYESDGRRTIDGLVNLHRNINYYLVSVDLEK